MTSEPSISQPPMTLAELRATRTALRQHLDRMEAIHATCWTCGHFDGRICQQFRAAPPEEFRTLVEQCDAWEYDHIPF